MATTIPSRDTILVALCNCEECKRFEAFPPDDHLMQRFTILSYDFDFQFPSIANARGGGDRSPHNLDVVTSFFEDADKNIPRTVQKTAEIIWFITYKDFERDGVILSLFHFAMICDYLMEDDLQTAIGTSDVAADFLQMVIRWFVYSWHACQHNRPEAETVARKFRKFLSHLVSVPIVAAETVAVFGSTTFWPVIGPADILGQLCNTSMVCTYNVSLLCNLTRIEGFPEFLNSRSTCITTIKDGLFESCLKMLEADELSGLLLLLLVNLAPVPGFTQFLIEANGGYFLKVVLLELVTTHGLKESIELATWQFLRNLSLVDEGREIIMAEIDKFLGPVLLPIAGPEKIDEEEMLKLPEELQYLSDTKERTENLLIKDCILDLLFALCRFRKDRIALRDREAYQILKHYHTFETDVDLREKIENVVNVLIRTEPEMGLDDMMDGLKLKTQVSEGERSDQNRVASLAQEESQSNICKALEDEQAQTIEENQKSEEVQDMAGRVQEDGKVQGTSFVVEDHNSK